jgi:elongation factor 1-gamma
MPALTSWFVRVARLPPFVRAFGYVKPCQKPIKPPKLPAKEKPKAEKKKDEPAQAAKPKPAAEEEKKAKNPLDALPPTPFDLFNFKTYYVNVPDKAGEGWDKFMADVDNEGWAFWHLHYEKYGKEGQVEYQFMNLLEGFLQRLDSFRKHAFGKMCMLGEEPNLEIAGILLIRGQVIPQECHDHP